MATVELQHFVMYGKKIAGAGLNYRSLLTERNLPLPKVPVIFLKPTSSYITEERNKREGLAMDIGQGI